MISVKKLYDFILNTSSNLNDISDKNSGLKIAENKWSRKEILGHLIDSAMINNYRITMSMIKDDLVFDTYPQDQLVIRNNYKNRKWDDLVVLWKSLNLHIVELISNIPEVNMKLSVKNHNFDKICWKLVDKESESTLEYLINDYFGHMEHHLKQIDNY